MNNGAMALSLLFCGSGFATLMYTQKRGRRMGAYQSFLVTLSILAALLHGVTMLQLVDLKVPSHTIRGQPVRLECHYDLEGEALYSVKWFKDGEEFFRFYPEDDPPAQMFRMQGVNVDLPNSTDTAVILKAVDVHGTGIYRCEVSAEAPSFKTVSNQKPMIVVDLPDASGPQIEGGLLRYHIGDSVRVNCSSYRSRPAATLKWYINQEPAEESFIRHYPIIQDEEGFQTSMLGLEFKVRQKHFKKGDLKLKCLATIDTLYWRSNEQSVEGDRPQKAPVLESRETFAPEASTGTSVRLSSTRETMNLLTFSLLVNILFVWLHYNDIIVSTFGMLHYFFEFSSNKTSRKTGTKVKCEKRSVIIFTTTAPYPTTKESSQHKKVCSPFSTAGELSSPSLHCKVQSSAALLFSTPLNTLTWFTHSTSKSAQTHGSVELL